VPNGNPLEDNFYSSNHYTAVLDVRQKSYLYLKFLLEIVFGCCRKVADIGESQKPSF